MVWPRRPCGTQVNDRETYLLSAEQVEHSVPRLWHDELDDLRKVARHVVDVRRVRRSDVERCLAQRIEEVQDVDARVEGALIESEPEDGRGQRRRPTSQRAEENRG